jgi:colanic acid biosynthesis glycosyl transferase WcaI
MAATKSRVFFVNRYFYPDESATSQLLADLVAELALRGYDVHVICSRQLYGRPAAQLPPIEIVKNVSVHRLWTTRFGRQRLLGRALDYLTFYAACGLSLMSQLQRGDIVIAMTDPPLISIVAALAARLKRAVLINWLQDVFPEVATQLGASPLPALLDAALRRLRDASLRFASANVVLGGRMAEYLRARGLDARSMHVIENWADADAVRPKASCESALRSQLGLDGQFVVGYSGNLGRAHEYETLLGAAEALRADTSVTFLLVGGGFNMEELKMRVAERGLLRIRFLPYQPRESLEDSLAAADVHLVSLIPSLEGLIVPSKFYGILAAGRPVVFIGDRDGELARVVTAARCGTTIGIRQGAALAQFILKLRDGDMQRNAMGLAARQLLCERYSTARAVKSWIDLLREVASPLEPARNQKTAIHLE